MERDVHDATECVGPLEMRIGVAESTPGSEQRWADRAEALANWLLAEWQRESQREAA